MQVIMWDFLNVLVHSRHSRREQHYEIVEALGGDKNGVKRLFGQKFGPRGQHSFQKALDLGLVDVAEIVDLLRSHCNLDGRLNLEMYEAAHRGYRSLFPWSVKIAKEIQGRLVQVGVSDCSKLERKIALSLFSEAGLELEAIYCSCTWQEKKPGLIGTLLGTLTKVKKGKRGKRMVPSECILVDDLKENCDTAHRYGASSVLFNGHVHSEEYLRSKLRLLGVPI